MNNNFTVEPLALFGGTFDPVHYGHLRCADEARQKLGLEKLFMLPSGTPAHRATPQATAGQRLDMLGLGLAEFPALAIDDREILRSGPSYMVDTLRELRRENPTRSVLLLVGQDAANRLHSWYQWEELFELANLVILTRPNEVVDYRHDLANKISSRLVATTSELAISEATKVMQLQVSPIDISATTIQSMMRLGRKPKSMMPDSVLDYIEENRLYFPDSTNAQ
jgi:nicotinate-nucleotide adenylyltransferase